MNANFDPSGKNGDDPLGRKHRFQAHGIPSGSALKRRPTIERPAGLCSLRYLLFKFRGLIFLSDNWRLLALLVFNLPEVRCFFRVVRTIELRVAFAYFVFNFRLLLGLFPVGCGSGSLVFRNRSL